MNIIPFQFENKHIRIITDSNGEPLFVGKDICEALGYANANGAMRQHCKGVAKRYPLQTAEGLYRVMDTGKRHGDGTMIQQIKWAESVVDLIHEAELETSDEAR